ncbi:MAG: hypothetical protein C4318_04030 [Acidimicrobiia bacterium]
MSADLKIQSERPAQVGLVDRKGQGRPVLYLHGFLGEGLGTPAVDHLAETGFEVLRPWIPGFQSIDELEGIDGFDDLSFWLVDLLDAEGLASVAVVGTCLGGWLAAEFAVRNPARVDRLVLTGAPGIQTERHRPAEFFGIPFDKMAELLFFDQSQPFAQLMKAASGASGRPIGSGKAVLPFLRSLAATARFAWNPYFVDPKLEARLGRIGCETLVVWGAEDRFLPVGIGKRWAEMIPRATFVAIPSCGHFPVLEKPEEWAHQVSAFLA